MQVYLNGQWLPEEQAQVSVFDRGFLFGDGVYEVVAVYGGRPLRKDAHIARLQRSLAETHMDPAYTDKRWADLLDLLAHKVPDGEGSIYLQVTRGAAPRQHRFPAAATATVFAYARGAGANTADEIACGIAAVLLPDIRWMRCDIKTTSLIANVLLTQEAVVRHASEALLVRDGHVNEGAASNVLVGRQGRLYTAAPNRLILNGITRELILELARQAGVDVIEESPTVQELRAADEVLITSSGREVLAVTAVDAIPVGNGRPGALFQTLHRALQDFKDAVRRGEAS